MGEAWQIRSCSSSSLPATAVGQDHGYVAGMCFKHLYYSCWSRDFGCLAAGPVGMTLQGCGQRR
jgi:hypothetical protein